MTRAFETETSSSEPAGELDLRALGAALKRRRRAVWLPTLVAFVLVAIYVNVATPRYTAESQVLLENQETFFTRPDRVNLSSEQANQVDQEAVASQVQLINSRDLARRAIQQLKLQGNPEFDPLAKGMNPLVRVLVLLGLAHDPTRDTADARIVTAFLEKLTVFSPPKTRVITIQFTSKDPDLAARAADAMASLYLQEQSAAKRTTAKDSAESLAAQISDLRTKLAKADAEREQYRSQSGLLAGSNNMTISGQQLAEINTDLTRARSSQADAQAKASMIRDLIRAGKAADVTEVINNDIVRRVSDQRVTAQAQLALESRTLLPGHPRIKELTAQVAQFDLALKGAAKQAATTLENEAKIAGQRVANLESVLTQQKQVAGVANTDEVHLRSLERAAQSYKDQLDSSSTKYQEALARQSSMATPADARVISRAAIPQEASFPKKLPFIIFGTTAAFVFSLGYVIAGELLSGRAAVVGDRPLHEDDTPGSAQRTIPRGDAAPTPVARASKIRTARIAASLGETAEPDPVFAPVEQGTPIDTRRRSSRPVLRWVADTIAYLKAFGLSAIDSRAPAWVETEQSAVADLPRSEAVGWERDDAGLDPIERRNMDRRTRERRAASSIHDAAADHDEPIATALVAAPSVEETSRIVAAKDDFSDIGSLVKRIVSAHVPGRGLHVVGTSFGPDAGATAMVIDLGRALAEKGRAIIVDLNRTPMKLASLATPSGDGRATIMTIHGLAELLAGESSFAEVIHRDHRSRLHFIPTGMQEADFRDFDLILDALSETYDFIVLLTPAYPQSEIAKVMAPYADFVVLTAIGQPDDATLAMLEAELIEAGAHEVLVAGQPERARHQVVA